MDISPKGFRKDPDMKMRAKAINEELRKPEPDLRVVESHLVKLGQGDYERRYVRAVPVKEVPAELVDTFRELLRATTNVQARSAAAASEMDIPVDHSAFNARSDNALADLTACAKHCEETVRLSIAVARLLEDLQR